MENLLVGWSKIAQAFGVLNKTVKLWLKQGAPIVLEDKPITSQSDLWEWLKARHGIKTVKNGRD